MRFVYDDEIRTGAQEVVAAAVSLYEVHRDDDEWIHIEDGLVSPEVFLQTPGGARQNQLGFDVEFRCQFALPLFGKMWWAEDTKSRDFTAIQHLACDQARFDCLADTNIIRNKQAYRIELKRHEQWHKLIWSRLYRQSSK